MRKQVRASRSNYFRLEEDMKRQNLSKPPDNVAHARHMRGTCTRTRARTHIHVHRHMPVHVVHVHVHMLVHMSMPKIPWLSPWSFVTLQRRRLLAGTACRVINNKLPLRRRLLLPWGASHDDLLLR